jgi:hypothetical protein
VFIESVKPFTPPKKEQDSAVPETPLGISVEFIRQFVRDRRKMEGFKAFTTAQICSDIVLKETRERGEAYIDAWRDSRDEQGRPLVSAATVFVSHAWKYEYENQ